MRLEHKKQLNCPLHSTHHEDKLLDERSLQDQESKLNKKKHMWIDFVTIRCTPTKTMPTKLKNSFVTLNATISFTATSAPKWSSEQW